MDERKVIGLAFSVIVLLLVTGSGMAGVSPTQPTEPVETSGAGASPGANAPWFNIEVDTRLDTGMHVSVAYDPWDGRTYISY